MADRDLGYSIKAHPTVYKTVRYRSRLEARWAAFFDLAGINFQYEPIDLNGWTPDFSIEWWCYHSMCAGVDNRFKHVILAEVKPFFSIEKFNGHPCMNFLYGHGIPADSSAAFGVHPSVTYWAMAHGNGGGDCDLFNLINSISDNIRDNGSRGASYWSGDSWDKYESIHELIDSLWLKAGNIVQWQLKVGN